LTGRSRAAACSSIHRSAWSDEEQSVVAGAQPLHRRRR
jgi:hypothetical protein